MNKKMKGMPVSRGIVIGKKAIVVSSTNEFEKLQGEDDIILIAKNFDPNYDVLLPHCRAVVSEIGSLLCHLAIVARIQNIPAVVNVNNATKCIKDGDIVSLDANNGILYKGVPDKPLSKNLQEKGDNLSSEESIDKIIRGL